MSSKYLLSRRVKCKRFNPLTKGITYKVVWSEYWGLNWASAFLEIQLSLNHTPRKAIMTMGNQSFEIWRCISYETGWVCIVMFSGVGGNYLRQFALNAWPFKTCSGFPTKNAGYLVWHLGGFGGGNHGDEGSLTRTSLGRRRWREREREIFRMEPFCWHTNIKPTSEQKETNPRSREGERQKFYMVVSTIVDTMLDGPVVWFHS